MSLDISHFRKSKQEEVSGKILDSLIDTANKEKANLQNDESIKKAAVIKKEIQEEDSLIKAAQEIKKEQQQQVEEEAATGIVGEDPVSRGVGGGDLEGDVTGVGGEAEEAAGSFSIVKTDKPMAGELPFKVMGTFKVRPNTDRPVVISGSVLTVEAMTQ